MFASGKTAATGTGKDAQFNYVTMLLHGDGTNGAQNNTFLDSSTNALSIIREGNTTQGSFSPYGSNWAVAFDGTSDYIETPSSSAFSFGTGAYTIEGWIFVNVMPSGGNLYQIFNFTDDAENLSINSSGTLNYYNGSTGTSSTATVSVGTWTHIAYTRSSTTIKAYINNTEVISASSSGNYTSNRTFVIGARAAATRGANCLNGYLNNVRVLKGTALTSFDLTTNLTAITNTVLLTCQSNRFVDNSSSPLTLTVAGNTSVQRFNPFGTATAYSTSVIGGSGYFDGTGDYLNVGNNLVLRAGTSDFTFESWVYSNGVAGNEFIADFGSSNVNGWGLYDEGAGGNLQFRIANVDRIAVAPLVAGSWNHVAVVRSGTTATLYVNGISVGSYGSAGTNLDYTGNSYIGTQVGSNNMNGYLSDVRLVKGTAVYTSNFTPPTAPLTAITNTSLLLSMTNGAIFDNAMMNDLETVGNAQISTSVKKYGTGSLYFDGNGDNLAIPTSPNLNMGTGNWTIECWVYVVSRTLSYPLIFGNNNSSYTTGALALTNSNADLGSYNDKFYLAAYDIVIGAPTLVASVTNTSNTWYHLALVRNGTNLSMYRNGTSVASTTISAAATFNWGTLGSRIGGGNWDGAQSYFNGYIDDLRITKGYARYTANFTAPTAALSDTGPY